MLTMDLELFVENSSLATVNTLPNTITYFEVRKVFEYQTEADLLYYTKLELKKKAKRLRMACFTMAARIQGYCVGN